MTRTVVPPNAFQLPPDLDFADRRALELLNQRLARIEEALDRMQGRGGAAVKLLADLDLGGHKILNSSQAVSEDGLLTRAQADALYSRQVREIVRQEIINTGGSGDSGTGAGGLGTVNFQKQTLTAASTEINWTGAAPVDGDLLVVILVQDGTGGRLISWGAAFNGSPDVEISTTPNKRSHYLFVGEGAKWWQLSVMHGV